MGDKWWCFAPDIKIAKRIITKEIFAGKKRVFSIQDVTNQYIKEDGVEYLIKNNFIGIPQRALFMLNGSMSAMKDHYEVKGRSATLWWSEKIPGSREIWK